MKPSAIGPGRPADGTTAAEAAQVCSRIREAVIDVDWGSVTAGLSVSVSIGVSEAGHGDTVESVLQRSDESIYRAKSLDRAQDRGAAG